MQRKCKEKSLHLFSLRGKEPTLLIGQGSRLHLKRQTLRLYSAGLGHAHPEARILGHHNLPKVHKACPCFDAAKEYEKL